MKTIMIHSKTSQPLVDSKSAGFTLIEVLIASTVMLIVTIAVLSLYSRSSQIAVDQNQLTQIQQDVRSGMFLISRDIRMTGLGMPQEYLSYFLQGINNENQNSTVTPDRLRLIGNMDDPLNLPIFSYNGGAGGGAAVVEVDPGSFEQNPYPDSYYEDKVVLVLPRPGTQCFLTHGAILREVAHVEHSPGIQRLNFAPGQAPDYNPPGGLVDTGCAAENFDDGLITLVQVKEYWLDTTGNIAVPAQTTGYIGNGHANILYMTLNNVHYPLAQDVEDLQFEFRGDFDNDGTLDPFQPWDNTWTVASVEVSRIRQIRIQILGRTARPFFSIQGRPSAGIQLYQRPHLSDGVAAGAFDGQKRFLIECVSNIRNMSLNIYNNGTR